MGGPPMAHDDTRDPINRVAIIKATAAIMPHSPSRLGSWRLLQRPQIEAPYGSTCSWASGLAPPHRLRHTKNPITALPHGRGLVDGHLTAHTADPVLLQGMGVRQVPAAALGACLVACRRSRW
jgi:hypothetical protein